jgi:hypothetical protein
MCIAWRLLLIFITLSIVLLLFGCNKKANQVLLQKIADKKVEYDENVVPINWDNLDLNVLDSDIAKGLVQAINNSNRYAVNTWWTQVKKFDKQDDQEYISIGGKSEATIRSISEMARLLAVSIKLNIYDESHTEVPLEEARAMMLKLVKSLAKAHLANTEGGWGDHWQSAFWAADVAFSGWLFWENFGMEDQEMIRKVVVHEANRFISYEVPYYMDKEGKIVFKGDTKAEENAWNANITTLACAMMPNHENHNLWMYKNLELIISSYALPEDVTSNKLVNKFRLKEILDGSNINSDGTVVNHNIVHPDYQTSVLTQNMTKAAYFAFGGMEVPEALIFNADIIYSALITLDIGKFNADKKGSYIYERNPDGSASPEINYPTGTDWGVDRQLNFFTSDVFAHVFNLDRDCPVKAIDYAHARMQVILSMQGRSDTGQYYQAGDSDSYALREEWVAFHLINTYLVLWAENNGLVNISKDTFLKPAPLRSALPVLPEKIYVGNEFPISFEVNKDLVVLPKDLKVKYYSSDESIVVIKNGVFKAVEVGQCKITVVVEYGKLRTSGTVSVTINDYNY